MQTVHHKRIVRDTSALRALAEKLFESPPPRQRITCPHSGKLGTIRRDAVWLARPDADGFFPLYRVYKQAYGDPHTSTAISTSTVPLPMPRVMCRALDAIAQECNVPKFNHVVLHRYVDESDQIGWHRDKYMDMAEDSAIASVSIGASRKFRMRRVPRPARRTSRAARALWQKIEQGAIGFEVHDGDVVVIPFALNEIAEHAVPRQIAKRGVRYSITARTMHTFFDPVRRLVRTGGEAPRPY